MKNLKKILLGVCVMFFASCTITQHGVTNNAVGDKAGVQQGFVLLNPKLDYSYQAAAKKGEINKIGTTEFKVTYFGPLMWIRTKLTGN